MIDEGIFKDFVSFQGRINDPWLTPDAYVLVLKDSPLGAIRLDVSLSLSHATLVVLSQTTRRK